MLVLLSQVCYNYKNLIFCPEGVVLYLFELRFIDFLRHKTSVDRRDNKGNRDIFIILKELYK